MAPFDSYARWVLSTKFIKPNHLTLGWHDYYSIVALRSSTWMGFLRASDFSEGNEMVLFLFEN